MTANATRGEVVVTLEGREYILRPSYEAICAFEADTGLGLLALLQQAEAMDMTIQKAAAICTRCIQAWGKSISDPMLEGVNVQKIAQLIMESDAGLLGIVIRLRLLLTAAATGGYTFKGELKAAGENGKTPAAN